MIGKNQHRMEFPVYLTIGALKLHPHPVFESIAYFVSLRLALRRFRQNSIASEQRGVIIAGGLIGGIVGAKILAILQHLDLLDTGKVGIEILLLGGKTIVGALLGAIVGVEFTKKLLKVETATGDVFAYPLIIGTAIGRIGCFLTGLSDQTYGTPTSLPWGVDFGDRVFRHPTQLYEVLFMVGLLIFLKYRERKPYLAGDLFRFYLICYLAFRWAIDFIKPDFHQKRAGCREASRLQTEEERRHSLYLFAYNILRICYN
jgi:phosphatidylglycerol---prolipoprotein diacylglyceryl transferase